MRLGAWAPCGVERLRPCCLAALDGGVKSKSCALAHTCVAHEDVAIVHGARVVEFHDVVPGSLRDQSVVR